MGNNYAELLSALPRWDHEAMVAPYRAELEKLCTAIEMAYPDLTAQVEFSVPFGDLAVTSELSLRVGSKFNLETWDALDFQFEGPDRLVSTSVRAVELDGLEAFKEHLAWLLKFGRFQESIRRFNETAPYPYTGILRAIDAETLGSRDVAIRMSNEAFNTLLAADAPVTIEIHPTDQLANIDPQKGYRYMTAEGHHWRITDGPQEVDGTWRLTAAQSH
ncbi:MAG: hypothetical protein AAFN74_20665 [Myxococcota bacterium]